MQDFFHQQYEHDRFLCSRLTKVFLDCCYFISEFCVVALWGFIGIRLTFGFEWWSLLFDQLLKSFKKLLTTLEDFWKWNLQKKQKPQNIQNCQISLASISKTRRLKRVISRLTTTQQRHCWIDEATEQIHGSSRDSLQASKSHLQRFQGSDLLLFHSHPWLIVKIHQFGSFKPS